jgi:Cys-tRNA(Pro)/Cys-tRNA(Cys) deacylase
MSGNFSEKKDAFTRALKELAGKNLPYRVLTFAARDKNAEEVTRETGFPLKQVVKTLLVRGYSQKYYLALCPGDRQAGLKALAKALKEKIVEMADREDVPKITGYSPGGVSPLGTRRPLPVVMDASIPDLPEIAVSAGQWGCQAVLRPRDLLFALGNRGRVAPFARPGGEDS